MGAVVVNAALTNNLTGTAVPISMPADIVAQRLLLVEVTTMRQMSMPGWTKIGSVANSITGQNTLTCFGRIATGGDTGSLAFVGGLGSASAICYQIGQWSGSLSGVKFAGNSGGLNPPKLTMTGSDEYLWLPFAANFYLPITGAPTGYTDLLMPSASGAFSFAGARRSLTAAFEDPGTFGGTSNGAVSATVAVSPGVVG